ncbi:MAG TPA: hypothetical protein VFI34_02700 [Candidatus Limnocylindrales bacterium]|nr:hypothetical protein [Candidatus Limnocylindrales bacterium]
MFSTLLGPLPPADPASGGVPLDPTIANVRALEDIGLELITGGGSPLGPATPSDAVVAAWRAAAGLTALPVKQSVLGPYRGGSREAAETLAASIAALADAGCPIVEVVEPNLAPIVASDAERARFVDAHRWLFAALGTTSPGIHCSLAVGGGNLDAAGAATFFDLPYPSYAFDLIEGPDNWRLIAAAPGDRGIVCGAISATAGADETRELLVWAAQYAASTGGRGIDRVGLANAGSLAGLPREVALRKLRRVAEASRIIATSSPDELARQLDPRAVSRGRGRRRRPAAALEPPAEA